MAEKVLMKGNEALAEAAMRAGCRFFFGYPITPQTELAAYMSKRMPKVGGTYLQAESEVAAINMVYGAAAAGARAMTSSSSPGISLKGEGISYMAGADLPGVIINVQRGGPGLGGIQPSQADYWQATRALGHGDFRVVVYAPSTVQEMADYAFTAFDVADRYRTPVMILADGMLGQMMEPVVMPEPRDERIEKPWATTGHKHQRAHNVVNSLYLTADELERLNVERYERYAAIERDEQRAEAFLVDDADVVVVAVKPYQVEAVLAPVKGMLAGKVVVSVAAGMTFDRYEEILAPGTHHLSTIPNTPVAVCEGIVVCERRHSLSEAEWQSVQALLSHVGLVIPVDTAQLGIAGTVCGCGPAFVAMFIEALADAAVKHGIVRADAYRMASQMVVGTGKLQLATGQHPAMMKDAVCSPGGTTIVGVGELERKRFRGAVIDAIDAIQDKK